eukprot:7301972-Alexandrium_andersonii.AAC.1
MLTTELGGLLPPQTPQLAPPAPADSPGGPPPSGTPRLAPPASRRCLGRRQRDKIRGSTLHAA